MAEYLCADCRRSFEAADGTPDACPRCGGALLSCEALTRLLDLLPEGADRDELPTEVEAAARNPENRIDRYILVDEVGQGGMGRVFRAWHSGLRKYVALKVMSGLSRFQRDRFLREARIAAGLRHPSIVQVYDLGQVGRGATETFFLSMEYVPGRPIHRIALSREEKLRLLVQIARAVDYSHQMGIVHRDIKPDNILVTDEGRAYLTDFGIAKQLDAGGVTATLIVGTPPYMAPEQARGEGRAVDARTDVYGLGATLYHLLCGRPPFPGENAMETLQEVLRSPPVPPSRRGARIPRDVETVCLKALEKDPARRYPSASAFADDLERAIKGEPILARPLGWAERMVRRVRRRPALLLPPLGVLLAAGYVVSLAILEQRARTREREIREALVRADGLIKDFDSEILLPPHDLIPKMGMLDEAIRICAALRADSGRPIPEADLLMARALARKGDLSRARDLLTEALAVREDPGIFFERGRIHLRLYEEEFVKLAREGTGVDRAELERVKREAWRWKERALSDLRRGSGDSPRSDRMAYARALIEYTEGSLSSALRLADRALREVKEVRIRTDLHALRGDILQATGDYAGAVRAYEEALSVRRSSGKLYFKKGTALLRQGGERALRQALAAFETALKINRRSVPALFGRARARQGLAEFVRAGGEDPTLYLEAAIEDFSRVIRSGDRFRRQALLRRAEARALLAEHRMDSGKDAAEVLRAAAADIDRLLDRPGTPAEIRQVAGNIHFLRARNEWSQARDPGPYLDRALAAYGEGGDARFVLGLGNVHCLRAQVFHASGRDPTPDAVRAVELYDRELRAHPSSVEALFNQGQARFVLALFRLDADPEAARAELQEAIRATGRALKEAPRFAGAYFERGKMRVVLAGLVPNPKETLRLAIRDFDRSLELRPGFASGYFERGRAWATLAEHALRRGESARKERESARQDLNRAVELAPSLRPQAQPLLEWLDRTPPPHR